MPIDRNNLPSYVHAAKGQWAVVKENKRSAHFPNPNDTSVIIVKVDGGLITKGERADYIVSHPWIIDVIVELKGSDSAKAIRQIRATAPIWRNHELAGKRLGALIVRGKGVNPKSQASVERWQREFRKTLRMKLVVETRNRAYEFTEFLLPE